MTAFPERRWYHLTRHFFTGLFDLGFLSDAGSDSFTRMVLGCCVVFFSFGLLITRIFTATHALLPTPEAFRLAVTLRNRGAMALALPSIDLGLTDAAGQLVARRMLSPSEWHAPVPSIQGGAELPLQLLLTAGGARVAGYTVEIFYP
jgi:hypothetical protein